MNTALQRPPPRQARAEEKRARILQAAEKLLEQVKPAELSTKAVAIEAGVPVGSVYRYFANAEALLQALFDSFNAQTLDTVESLPLDSDDWRADLSRVLDVVKRMHAEHPAYGPLQAHLGPLDEDADTILLTLTHRMTTADASLGTARAKDIAAMVVGIAEAAERRFHNLPAERRHDVFTEAGKAIEAYLSLYLR